MIAAPFAVRSLAAQVRVASYAARYHNEGAHYDGGED